MEYINQFFPITVIVAILLFVTREIIDSIKRYRMNLREIIATKQLFSAELERNYWTYKQLFRTIKNVKEMKEHLSKPEFYFIYTHDGRVLYRCDHNGEFFHSHVLVDVHEKIYDRVLIEVAKLDNKLFESMQKAYISIRKLSDFRNSLISYIEQEIKEDEAFFDDWIEYALKHENEIYSDMNALYKLCSNSDLKEHRLD